MQGYFHRALVVNLSERSYRYDAIPASVCRHYLGGKGFGAYYLLKRKRGTIDPLSPENDFILALGPASDTPVWGTSRYGVFAKSPLTGIFGESYSGGRVAESISRTGNDVIILEGASLSPVYLEINEKGVTFRDARDLWGFDTYRADDEIRKRAGAKEAGIIVIGPAGENRVKFASIVNNYWRCAGRAGIGAVLGSKMVKGIAFSGRARRECANAEGLKMFHKEWLRRGKEHPVTKAFRNFGTPGLVSVINTVGAFPTRYWSEGVTDGWEQISAEALHRDFSVRRRACNGCFMACGRLTTIRDGKYKGLTIEGPEYETIYAFGGLCLVKDLNEIIYLNDVCDRLGMDTITAGNLAAFTIESARIGRVKEDLKYGDAAAIANLLNKIARREGVGAILAEGIRAAASEWGLEDFAIHAKGMEPGGYDPRVFKGMGLAYATSDRGGCHIRSTVFRAEMLGITPPDQVEGKAKVFLDFEDRLVLQDALILCRFYRDIYLWDEMAEIVKLTTGADFSIPELQGIASTIQNAARSFNLAAGISRSDDTLPRRFFEEAINEGKNIITPGELERLKDDYYSLRGWDRDGTLKEPLPCMD